MNAPVAHPLFLTLKAALAAALAIAVCNLAGVPDVLSASFVGVLSVSPTLVTGVRRSMEQLVASALAGLVAAGCALVGMPTAATAGVSVALCIGLAFALGFGRSYAVSAFSALYVVLIPLGGPTDTLAIRLAAVVIGSGCALLVNAVVTTPFYVRVFTRRVHQMADKLERAVAQCASHGLAPVQQWDLDTMVVRAELRDALAESRWHPKTTRKALAALEGELSTLLKVGTLVRSILVLAGPEAVTSLQTALAGNSAPANQAWDPLLAQLVQLRQASQTSPR